MTVAEFCNALTGNVDIILLSGEETVAWFRSAYSAAITQTYLESEIESFEVETVGSGVKVIRITLVTA